MLSSVYSSTMWKLVFNYEKWQLLAAVVRRSGAPSVLKGIKLYTIENLTYANLQVSLINSFLPPSVINNHNIC